MAVFDWRDSSEGALEERFDPAEGAVGVKEWRALVQDLRELAGGLETPEGFAAIGNAFDSFLQTVNSVPRPRTHPTTVFVSHQCADAQKAARAAWEATRFGFDYWLDIHNPVLHFANTTSLPLPIKAVLIAAIIEMGLLNSTHVVTMQTSSSRASRWVPYEFGRAKHRHVVSTQAASWFETGVVPDPGGDYLSLAACAFSKSELVSWLGRQPGARRGGPNTVWRTPGVIPPDLPN